MLFSHPVPINISKHLNGTYHENTSYVSTWFCWFKLMRQALGAFLPRQNLHSFRGCLPFVALELEHPAFTWSCEFEVGMLHLPFINSTDLPAKRRIWKMLRCVLTVWKSAWQNICVNVSWETRVAIRFGLFWKYQNVWPEKLRRVKWCNTQLESSRWLVQSRVICWLMLVVAFFKRIHLAYIYIYRGVLTWRSTNVYHEASLDP